MYRIFLVLAGILFLSVQVVSGQDLVGMKNSDTKISAVNTGVWQSPQAAVPKSSKQITKAQIEGTDVDTFTTLPNGIRVTGQSTTVTNQVISYASSSTYHNNSISIDLKTGTITKKINVGTGSASRTTTVTFTDKDAVAYKLAVQELIGGIQNQMNSETNAAKDAKLQKVVDYLKIVESKINTNSHGSIIPKDMVITSRYSNPYQAMLGRSVSVKDGNIKVSLNKSATSTSPISSVTYEMSKSKVITVTTVENGVITKKVIQSAQTAEYKAAVNAMQNMLTEHKASESSDNIIQFEIAKVSKYLTRLSSLGNR